MRRGQNQTMKIYSDFAGRRTRQIIADLAALVAIGLWVWFGVIVFNLVNELAVWGKQMQEAGSGFEGAMSDVGETLGGIPLIGSGIRIPFDGASEAGAALEAAGIAQQDAVLQLAITLGIGIPLLPILTILAVWLIPRIMFIRRASRAKQVVTAPAGMDLLALRALTSQKLSAIAKVDVDALGAWRRGEPDVVRRLAQLEAAIVGREGSRRLKTVGAQCHFDGCGGRDGAECGGAADAALELDDLGRSETPGVTAAKQAPRRGPAERQAQRHLHDRLVVAFADELTCDTCGEPGGVSIRPPLPEQPVAIVGDSCVLSTEVGEETRHRGDRAADLQLVEHLGVIGQVAPEGVLRKRDTEPTGGHPESLGLSPAEAPARIDRTLSNDEGAP